MGARSRRLTVLLPALLLGLLAGGPGPRGRAEERVDLERLREALLGATTRTEVDAALDALAARIGGSPGFQDAGAFGDYLGRLPGRAAQHPRVRLRRGWAYLAAGRAEAAVDILHPLASAGGEDAPIARAYLGEAARQTGDFVGALELLASAAREGYHAPFVVDSAHKAAFQLRAQQPSKAFEALPAYVGALEGVLAALDDATLHGVLARWLLDDYGAYAVPGRDRARLWASRAADHALAALGRLGVEAAGDGTRLAFDAAEALAPEDRATRGATLRFDLLAWAYRLGDRPDDDAHTRPAAIALLAEAALAEGRYALAARLARQRLEISDSPAARRVLAALPPDLGD